MKRSSKSSFLPNMIVFPGGATDSFDKHSKWLEYFNCLGIEKHQLDGLGVVQSQRPFIYDRNHWVHQSGDHAEGPENLERFDISCIWDLVINIFLENS